MSKVRQNSYSKGLGAFGAKVALGAGAALLLTEGIFTRPAGDGTLDSMPELTPEQQALGQLRQERIAAGTKRVSRKVFRWYSIFIKRICTGGWINGPQSGYSYH